MRVCVCVCDCSASRNVFRFLHDCSSHTPQCATVCICELNGEAGLQAVVCGVLGGPVGVGGCIDVDEVGEMGKATGWLLGVFFFFLVAVSMKRRRQRRQPCGAECGFVCV